MRHEPNAPLPDWMVAVVVVALIAVAFVSTLAAPFLMDDHARIVSNEAVHAFWPPWRHFVDPTTSAVSPSLLVYRPWLPLSLSIDVAMWGLRPAALRATNVVAHLGVVWLTFGVMRELLRSAGDVTLSERNRGLLALTIAGVTAVHPIAFTTVNFISARDIVFAQLGVLIVLWTYLRYRRVTPARWSRPWWTQWSLMLGAMAFAMWSKQHVVVVPVLLWLADVLLGRVPLRDPSLWRRPLPFVAVVIAWMLVARGLLPATEHDATLSSWMPWTTYAYTQAKLHATEYAAALFWPHALRYFPLVPLELTPWNPRTLAGVAVVVSCLLVVWRYRRRAPLVAFGLASYGVLMALESSVLPFHNLMTPYRQYPALPFIALALALGVRQVVRGPVPQSAVALLGVGACLAVTWSHHRHWASEVSFWTHATAHGADARAHRNLAAAIADPRDPRVRIHLDEAARLEMGFRLIARPGATDDNVAARFVTDPWAASDTSVGRAHFWRAHAHREAGRMVEARAEADRAADAAPHIASYQWYAAMDAQNAMDWDRVVVLAQRMDATDTDPSSVAFLGGAALQNLGRNQEAVDWYLRYLALPAEESSLDGRRMVTMNLAIAATAMGRCELARPQLLERQREQPTERAIAGLLAACPGR